MTIRRVLLTTIVASMLASACGDDEDDAPAAEAPAESAPASPAPPPSEPSEEEEIRAWAAQMHAQALAAVQAGQLSVDAEDREAFAAQQGQTPIRYAISTTYVGEGEDDFSLYAVFFPDRPGVLYQSLRRANAAGWGTARDQVAPLALWDRVIRRRISEESCAFDLVDPAQLPEGISLGRYAQADLDAFGDDCATWQAALEAGAQRSRRYAVEWSTDGATGYVNFSVGEDGQPSWREISFYRG